jgi:hypothetical protein
MGVPNSPTYAKLWKTKRQNRIKPTGMTKLLEKCDTLWKGYDPDAFIRAVMGKGDNGLRDIERNIKGFGDASNEISDLEKTNAKVYDKDEKAVIKKILGDLDEEIVFWKAKKKTFVLEEGGAKMAEDKVMKTSVALNAAMDKAEARAKQLEALYTKLSAADRLQDHRPPLNVYQTFQKSGDDFEKMLDEADVIDRKLESAIDKVKKAYANDDDLVKAMGMVDKAREVDHKRLKALWGDRTVWRMWVEKQLTSASSANAATASPAV